MLARVVPFQLEPKKDGFTVKGNTESSQTSLWILLNISALHSNCVCNRQQPAECPDSSTDGILANGNILTGLFKTSFKVDIDYLGSLQSLHRRVLERLFPQVSNQPSRATVVKCSDEITGLKNLPQHSARPGLSSKEAGNHLTRYQDLCGYFPFVLLPENWTLTLMLRNHRFLLLGVLSAMSASNLELHSSLDAEFRRVFSEKVVIHGEKSLDILQGLLVYIAWWAQDYPA
jgi:hypothetical protein